MDLYRFAYTPEDTQGQLVIGDWSCWTIEQPWVRWDFPGGKPFASCIPDGEYKVIPFTRPGGEEAFALVNERLGVYFHKGDRLDGKGRYLCLIHAGNYASDVEGCIAPGKTRTIYDNRLMVTSSRDTMREIQNRSGDTLRIHAATGAIDTPLAMP